MFVAIAIKRRQRLVAVASKVGLVERSVQHGYLANNIDVNKYSFNIDERHPIGSYNDLDVPSECVRAMSTNKYAIMSMWKDQSRTKLYRT
jgi:hypothetical protein